MNNSFFFFRSAIITRSFTWLFFLLVVYSCNTKSEGTGGQKTVKVSTEQKNEYEQLHAKFKEWKKMKIKDGHMKSKCLSLDEELIASENGGTRFGDHGDHKVDFGDYNRDGKMDGLFIFWPEDCLQGNGRVYSEEDDLSVLISSRGDGYKIDSEVLAVIRRQIKQRLKRKTSDMMIYFESMDKYGIAGNYVGYTDQDASCCPSIKGNFSYGAEQKDLMLTEDN
jgi:hypothetical protein